MIAWTEAQPPGVIALLVFGFCYALAGAVLLVVRALAARPSVAATLKGTTPTMLTPLSLIAGLLIAFLAARVWANLDHANGLVAREAGAVHEALRLADALPADAAGAVREALRGYLRHAVAEDFADMAAGRASSREPAGLAAATAALLAVIPANAGQRIAQDRAVAAVERASEARRGRVLLSRAAIAPLQWLVVIVLDALILVVIAMVHIDRRATAAINMALFSTAFAACLVLLMVHDGPFAAGGYTVRPDPLLELGRDAGP